MSWSDFSKYRWGIKSISLINGEISDVPIAGGLLKSQTSDTVDPVVGVQPTAIGSWWISVNRIVLITIILGYYILVTAAAVALFDVCRSWAQGMGQVDSGRLSLILLVALLTAVAIRLVSHLWHGVVGLVSGLHDKAGEPITEVTLPRDRHPDLYALVAEVGHAIGAPLPDEIRITDQAECYVSEERRFSLSTQRRLILVLGFPHLAMLSIAELKVILTHELAHFRSGDTTLGVFIYRFLESRRAWLHRRQERRWYKFDVVYWIVQASFQLFLLVSLPLRRYQELRADCVSAAYCGGELASHTLLKEWLLAHQYEVALEQYRQEAPDGAVERATTPFRYFSSRWHEFSDAAENYLEQRLTEEEKPAYLDSHPTTRSRLDLIRRFPSREHGPATPASTLLGDFVELEGQIYPGKDTCSRQSAFSGQPEEDRSAESCSLRAES